MLQLQEKSQSKDAAFVYTTFVEHERARSNILFVIQKPMPFRRISGTIAVDVELIPQ